MVKTKHWYEHRSKKKQKIILGKIFHKLINKVGFQKNMEKVKEKVGIKLAITEAGRNYLVSEPKYHKTKFFLKIY